jgi:hypothetical protein
VITTGAIFILKQDIMKNSLTKKSWSCRGIDTAAAVCVYFLDLCHSFLFYHPVISASLFFTGRQRACQSLLADRRLSDLLLQGQQL